jgi:hypothetical protein
VDLAVFSLVLVLGVALAAFCAGWIFHEQTDRDR